MRTEVLITDKVWKQNTNITKQVVRSEISTEYRNTNIHVDNYFNGNNDAEHGYSFTLQGLPLETLEAIKIHIDKAIQILK